MRIDDTLEFFPKDKSGVLLANRTAWTGEITGPDFVSARRALRSGCGEVSEERRVLEVMEVVARVGGF